jgi:hypothetical protein
MADFNDPVALSLQQRAGYPTPQGMSGQDYIDATQPFVPQQAPQAPAMGGSAMGAAVSVGGPGDDNGSAMYGYNPQTKQLLVNGRIVPADFALWRHASEIPDDQLQAMPRSAIFQAGFQPIDKGRLQSFIQHIDDTAESHRLSDAGHAIAQTTRNIAGGLFRGTPRFIEQQAVTNPGVMGALAAIAHMGGAPAVNQGFDALKQAKDIGAGMSDAISQDNAQINQERRAGQSLEQQAYSDASFGDHPGRYISNIASNDIPGMAPAVAAFMVNPALGATVFGAQGQQAGAETAADRFDQATQGLSPDQMNASNPAYAQLRSQGMSDMQARDALRRHAQDVGGDVTGALSFATAPLAGRIPLAAMGRATALAPAMGGEGAAAWLARRIGMAGLTGLENMGINAAANVPGMVASDVASGNQLHSVTDYAREGLDPRMFTVGALLGTITPSRAAAQSDIGAAATAAQARAEPPPLPRNDFAPSQGPAPQGMPEMPGQGARAPQQGMSQDMFAGPTRPPTVPGEAPAPEAAPTTGAQPGQGALLPDVGPQLPVPKAGLIKQRAAEQAASANAPEPTGPAGALPAPGPTPGQHGMVESARQSLALVQNLIDSGQFNKRTKSGKATLDQLSAERDRLTAQLQQADNAVLGEQIGQARAERGQPQGGPSFVEDAQGQRQLPGVGEPGVPAGEPPVGNTQPAPIGQNAPMSPAEAASRLQAQRARLPERQEPQGDMFPRQLKQGLQGVIDAAAQRSDEGVSPSTPEPKQDLAAQMAALQDGSRNAVFVAAGNEAQAPKVKGKVVQKVARPEGTLYTTDRAKAKAYREAPQVDDALLAQLQDLPQPKAEALRAGDDTVTQAVDKNGAVVKEALGSGNAPAVAEAAPKGGAVRQVSAARAQARREALNAGEAVKQRAAEVVSKPSKTEAVKNQAAERAAEKATKKKVPAEPVTPEEVASKQAADRSSVRKAEASLRKDVEANHPEYANDVAERPEHEGAGRKAESPLTAVPLTREEMGALSDRTHATAQIESQAMDAGKWSPAKSIVARILDAANLKPRSPGELKAAIRDMARMDPEQLRTLLGSLGDRLGDSTLAKGIVRGMDNVRAAVQESGYEGADVGGGRNSFRVDFDQTPRKVGEPAKGAPVLDEAASTDRIKVYGRMPANTAKVLQHWSDVVERNAKGSMPDEIHVMSPADANARYGTNLPEHISGATSADVRNPETGKPERVVVWNHEGPHAGAALESLAHEMGHVISDHVYDKLPKEDRAAVDQAFKDWLDSSGRMTPKQQIMDRAPPALRKLLEQVDYEPSKAYASEWREWIADETAKWLMTDQKPRSAVDRFFAKIADALKALYANVPGLGKPTEAVQRMMDNWVAGNRAVRENDAAARTMHMDYNRTPVDAIPPTEAASAKVRLRAAQQAAGETARSVGETFRDALSGDRDAVHRKVNNLISELGQSGARDVARKVRLMTSSMEDLVRSYGKRGEFGKHLVDWDTAMRLAEKTGREAQQAGQIALEHATRLSTPARKALEQLMYKATVYGVHPDEAFGQGKNKHLLDDDQAVEDANLRRYNEVKRQWDQLQGVQGDPQHIYQQLRDAMGDLRTKAYEAKRDNVDKLPVSAEAKEEAHKAINAEEARSLQGPYFPLMRDGKYLVTAMMPAKPLGTFDSRAEAVAAGRKEKAVNPHAEIFPPTDNGDGTWSAHAGERAMYRFDSEGEARRAKPQIEEEMREAWSHRQVDMDKAQDELSEPVISEPFTAVDFFRKTEVPQLGKFMAEVNKLNDSGQLDPGAYKRLSEMAIESLPENSPRASLLQRQNIRGASEDMISGYARRLAGAANTYGKLVHGPEINKAWAGMAKKENLRSDPAFGDVMNDLQERQRILAERMTPTATNRFASAAQDASSLMSLGLSPALLIQQLLQPTVVSAPVMAARNAADGKAVGYGRVMDALKDAYSGTAQFFGKRGMQQFAAELKRVMGTYGGDSKTLQESAGEILSKFGRNDGERAMLKYLNDRGLLDFSFLNAYSDAASTSKVGSKAKAVMRLSMAFAQQVETMNRVVTGLAAYRLAREARGMDHADAARDASAIVSQTHGDYSRYNRPSAFNRPLGGMMLQFKMYTQFMYSLFAHNIATAMDKNASREDRAQAVRTLGYVIGSHATFAGAAGLGPVATAAKLAMGGLMYGASGAGLIDKKKKDQTLDDWMNSVATDLGDEVLGKGNGKELVRVGKYGAPALLGLDLSNRIGLPDLMDTRYTGKPLGEKAQTGDFMDRALITAMGPVWSNAKRLGNGMGALMQGDVQNGAKNILPAAPRAVLTAINEAMNGVQTANGQQIRDRADMNPLELFTRALGVPSAATSEAYDERTARYAAKDRIQTERDKLLQEYHAAKGSDRADVLKDIAAFNQDRDKQFKITSSTLANELKRKALSKSDQAAAKAIGQ